MSALIDLDRAFTTWIAAQCASLWLQWPLALITTVGVGGAVWFALAIAGWVRADRLSAARSPSAGALGDAAGEPECAAASARSSSAAAIRAACWRAMLAVALSLWLVDGVAKPLVRRDRPYVGGPEPSALAWRPTTSSFPSGHAASSAAGALALARACPPAAAPLSVLAGLVVLSRVGLGMHYVGDVLAGILLGLAVATFVSPRVPRAPAEISARG